MPSTDQQPADPRAAERRRTSVAFRRGLRTDPPSYHTDNRWAQASNYTGVVHVAIRAVADAMSAATVTVTKHRRTRSKTTLLPGAVGKAVPRAGATTNDAEMVPVNYDHPLASLFRRVNAVHTPGDFFAQWIIQRNLTGTAHIWTPRSRFGKPAELWVLPTALLTPRSPTLHDPHGAYHLTGMFPGVTGWVGIPGSVEIDGREVVRHRHTHPLYQSDGYSPLTAGGVQVDVLQAIDRARKSSMDNQVDPSMILALKGATEEEVRRITEEIANRHGGAGHQRKVFGVDAESVTATLPARAAKDMDYGSGWEQMVRFTLALFGVQATVSGLTEAGNYAAVYAARRQFYDATLKVLASQMSGVLTKHLAVPYYGDGYAVQVDVPPPDDLQQLDRQYDADVGAGLVSYNEARALRNRPGVGPEGDVPVSVYVGRVSARSDAEMQAELAPPEQQAPPETPDAPPVAGGPGESPDAPPQAPAPDNPAAEGSLPPRPAVTKSMVRAWGRGLFRKAAGAVKDKPAVAGPAAPTAAPAEPDPAPDAPPLAPAPAPAIDPRHVDVSESDDEHLATWHAHDPDGRLQEHAVQLTAGSHRPPGATEATPVYRWYSFSMRGVGARGDWTSDRDAAVRDGEGHAERNHQEPPEGDESGAEADGVEDDTDPDGFPTLRAARRGPSADASEVASALRPSGPAAPGDSDVVVHGRVPVAKADAVAAALFRGTAIEGSDHQAFGRLTGAPDGATVRVLDVFGRSAVLQVEHPDVERCDRTLGVDGDGTPFCHNDYFRVKADAQGKGLGREVFAAQVESLSAAGFGYISTHAAGDWSKRDTFIGYYVWPLMGYDQSLSPSAATGAEERKVYAAARRAFPGAGSVQDVFEREGGREWWKKNGTDLPNAWFDLDPGSRSMAKLRQYLADQDAKAATTPT